MKQIYLAEFYSRAQKVKELEEAFARMNSKFWPAR